MIPRPMKRHWFQALLALSGGDLHGYSIQRTIRDQTGGHMRLWPAQLYRSLNTLEEARLIRQVSPPDDEPDDERRTYYSLTRRGRERLNEEVEMMAQWVESARSTRST